MVVSRSSRPLFQRPLFIVLVAALVLLAYGFTKAGHLLVEDDPIQHADAIVVLAGTVLDRPLEAVDLYKRGDAPVIVLTRETPELSIARLAQRGIRVPTKADTTYGLMRQLGVPAGAIIVPDRVHDNTAQEAQTFRTLAAERHWHRLIVVTSAYHTRRAGFALRREMKGTGIEIEMHATRYEDVNPDRWWATRDDLRWVLDESLKLIAYELGLGA